MDTLALFYWAVVTHELLSDNEPAKAVVRDTRVYEGHNWGYSLIFFSLMMLCVTLAVFFRYVEPTTPGWKAFFWLVVALSPIAGMMVGYHYHVIYLNQ